MTLRDRLHTDIAAQPQSVPPPSLSARTAVSSCRPKIGINDNAAAQANLTLRDVINATKMSRSTIHQMRQQGAFPEPTARRGGKMYWCGDVISAWLIANPPSNLGRARRYKPVTVGDDPKGKLQRLLKDLVLARFIPAGATHFITMNLGNPGSASSFNAEWAPKSRKIARRFINILGRTLFGKAGWADPANKARLNFFIRLEIVPRDERNGPETHLHLHAMIDLSGPFPAGCFSALSEAFKAKLQESFAADAFGFRINTKIQYILNDDHRRDIADYMSKKVWIDADRIYNRENL